MAITLDGTNGITSPDFEPSSSTTPTNGLYLPATNALGFATNSTERVRIDSSGNVGIGTSSPSSKLQITAANATLNLDSTNRTWWVGSVETGASDANFQVGTGLNRNNTYLTLTPSGNLGLGVTPSAWETNSKALQLSGGSVWGFSTSQINLLQNAYYNASGNLIYNNTAAASAYRQISGVHSWYTAPSGTAGAAISFTQAMTLDASGNLGVGTTSPVAKFNAVGHSGNIGAAFDKGSSAQYGVIFKNSAQTYTQYVDVNNNNTNWWALYDTTNSSLVDVYVPGASAYRAFYTVGSERARIDSSGNLLVGTTSAAQRLTVKGTGVGALSLVFNASSAVMVEVNGSNTVNGVDGAPNANGLMRIWRDSGNLRSISAAGTINASGADYAEYMVKASDFEIAKGDICGVDANGLLTNVFSNAASFVVKSTDPSYVGNDSWGAGIEDKEMLEAERQKVDRIAFAGQVPVNVFGAKAGDYIIPVADKKGIKGEAVSNPTFEQYQIAVGKVIAIESDGRAKIIVKVA